MSVENKIAIPVVNFTQLSDWGLIVEINKKILHPLGLALTRDPENGMSIGALVADDFVWQYSPEVYKDANKKLRKFRNNRIKILTKILKDNNGSV